MLLSRLNGTEEVKALLASALNGAAAAPTRHATEPLAARPCVADGKEPLVFYTGESPRRGASDGMDSTVPPDSSLLWAGASPSASVRPSPVVSSPRGLAAPAVLCHADQQAPEAFPTQPGLRLPGLRPVPPV